MTSYPRKSLHRAIFFVLTSLLCVAANAAEPAGYFNVRSFGAAGDGKTLDSPAINSAIDAAAKAGGGTVILPAGTYLSGSIHLKSNIDLMIDAGAIILGAPQAMHVYDPTEPFEGKAYQDGGHTFFHNSLIWGENLTNVTISGHGMIKGGGLVTDDGPLDDIDGFSSNPPASPPAPDALRIGNKAICLKLCRNVLIRDVTILRGGHFAILVTGCDNMAIDHVTIDTNRDGMDIDCCRNTTVSNCLVNSPNDDGICPKSTYALGKPRLTENLTITNCQVSGFAVGTLLDGTMKPRENGNGRIKFGTESSGGFRNCTVSNCTFRHCRGLALEEVDGGVMDDITISNIAMFDVPSYAIYITTGKRDRTPNLTTQSSAGNILISNVVAEGVGRMSGIQVMGLPEQPIVGVRLENIRLISKGGGTQADAALHPQELGTGYPEPDGLGTMPAYGIFARHVRDLDLANIHFSFTSNESRPAASFTDVEGLDIDNLQAQLAQGVPGAVFAPDVQGLVIRDSPALEPQKK
ncbi:MAG: glycoside hydrolase family 28 protein [Chthoniobacteraceae bacterium]|jgi:polygalacturonase